MQFPKKSRSQAVKDGDETDDKDPSVAQGGSFKALHKSRLFSPKAATGRYMNQKLLRLSPVARRDKSTKRIGALGNRDAESSEILIFDATTQTPSLSSVKHAIDLEGKDAQDLDLWQSSEGSFTLAYCTNFSIHILDLTYDFASKTCKPSTGIQVHKTTTPGIEFRCLRFLSRTHLLVSTNNRTAKNSTLSVLTLDRKASSGRITSTTRLPGARNINTMDVTSLDGDLVTGERQILAAAAGADGAIHIASIDYKPALQDPAAQIRGPRIYETLRDVHGGSGIAKLALAPFFPPVQPPDSPKAVVTMPSYARLASVALFSDSVVVEHIALTSVPTSPQLAPEITGTQTKIPAVRWVLSSASAERFRSWSGLLLIAFVVLVSAFLLQGYVNADPRLLAQLQSLRAMLPEAPGAGPALREQLESAVAAQKSGLDTVSSLAAQLTGAAAAPVQSAVAGAVAGQTALVALVDRYARGLGAAPPSVREKLRVEVETALESQRDRVSEAVQYIQGILAESVAQRAAADADAESSADTPPPDVEAEVNAADDADSQAAGIAAVRDTVERARQAVPPAEQAAAPDSSSHAGSLADLVAAHVDSESASAQPQRAVVVRPHGDSDALHVGIHEEADVHAASEAVAFEKLSAKAQAVWKDRLVRAGRWSVHEGEVVLKGILFSEYAAVVGGGIRDAILH